jgi:hypothetical protein
MMYRNIKFIVFFKIILSFLSGCTSNENLDIMIDPGTLEFSYIEMITGQETIYTKEIEAASLESIMK